MYKLWGLLFLSLTLFGATPKLYEAVGNPIYQQINSVEKIAEIGYFSNQKVAYKDFVARAKATKKLGFEYDKQRKKGTLSKAKQKAYLRSLRELDKELRAINLQAKEALATFVKRRYVKSFYQLKASKLSVLQQDPDSRRLIKSYSKELEKQKQRKAKQKADRQKQKQRDYAKMLRSAKNLNGVWKGKSSDGSHLKANFKGKTLALHYSKKEKEHIFKGSYFIDSAFHFTIKSRILIRSDKEHIRHVNIKRKYKLIKITTQELVLQFKDEVLSLKR